MLTQALKHIIEHWIKELQPYSFMELCAKPAPVSWSLGQVYMHLINDTNFFVTQIKVCLTTNDDLNGEASAVAKMMFQNNAFSDELIEGPASNARTPQPASKEELTAGLINLQRQIDTVAELMQTSDCKGKTKHPGLGYFNANDWLRFAEMHFRHHLRQKKRIDDFLKSFDAS